MAIPPDMQPIQTIVFKADVELIDRVAAALRKSRSEIVRDLIERNRDALAAHVFFMPTRSFDETNTTPEHP